MPCLCRDGFGCRTAHQINVIKVLVRPSVRSPAFYDAACSLGDVQPRLRHLMLGSRRTLRRLILRQLQPPRRAPPACWCQLSIGGPGCTPMPTHTRSWRPLALSRCRAKCLTLSHGCAACQCELQSDPGWNHNYIAANTNAHLGNPSHLTHNAKNLNAQCTAPQYLVGCRKKIKQIKIKQIKQKKDQASASTISKRSSRPQHPLRWSRQR